MITVIMTKEDVLQTLSAPADMSPGRSVMWVLTPEDESAAVGDSVRAVIQWDSEQNSLSAEAVEGRNVLSWVKADYNADEDGFEVSGQDYTGEGADSDQRDRQSTRLHSRH